MWQDPRTCHTLNWRPQLCRKHSCRHNARTLARFGDREGPQTPLTRLGKGSQSAALIGPTGTHRMNPIGSVPGIGDQGFEEDSLAKAARGRTLNLEAGKVPKRTCKLAARTGSKAKNSSFKTRGYFFYCTPVGLLPASVVPINQGPARSQQNCRVKAHC